MFNKKSEPTNPISDEEGYNLYGDRWNDPIFRQKITGVPFDIDAHMNDGELKYGGSNRLGSEARGIWWQRNVAGQGHPGEDDYLKSIGKGRRGKEG